MSECHQAVRPFSIKRIFFLCIGIQCVCVALILSSCIQVHLSMTRDAKQYAEKRIEEVVQELSRNNQYLENTILTQAHRTIFEKNDMEWVSAVETLQKMYQLCNDLSQNRYSFFIYSQSQKRFVELTGVQEHFEVYSSIRAKIIELAEENCLNGQYRLIDVGNGRKIILCMWKNTDFVCGTWLTQEIFLQGLALSSQGYIARVELLQQGEVNQRKNQFTIQPAMTDFTVSIVLQQTPEQMWLYVLQLFQVMFSIIAMMVLLETFHRVERDFLRPAQSLTEILRKYSGEDCDMLPIKQWDVRVTLEDANIILKSMGQEIERLSLRLYESKMAEQQMELNFRNLQIRPHFLVNCLAMLNGMAQLGKTEEIKHMTICIADYYRYVLHNVMDSVTLSQELRHLDDIIEINSEWNDKKIEIKYEIQPCVRNAQIPILMVSTFVENSIKHAKSETETLHITVQAERTRTQHGDQVRLMIIDDGAGFPQSLIAAVETGEIATEEKNGRRIGINNALQRLRLIYKGKASLHLYNGETNGARVEIQLPLEDHES